MAPWSQTPEVTRIAALYVYPIKSCRGISVTRSPLLKEGLEFDRRFMLVDANYKFLTIRQNPRLTLVLPEVRNGCLKVSIQGRPGEFEVPARPTSEELSTSARLETVEIWGKTLTGHILTDPVISALLSEFLEQEVHLAYHQPEKGLRKLGGNGSLTSLGRTGSVAYADVLPLQFSSLASLAELNDRLVQRDKEVIPIQRFRPNIVVEGLQPWEEDTWSLVSLVGVGGEGKLQVDIVCRCARCQVPNVDTETAVKDSREPWDTLMQ